MSGTLFIVATPIGNLGDITHRAVETLKKVDFVCCEDTRRAGKLLQHFGIKNRLVRYDEHSHKKATPKILSELKSGAKAALITDAGTPGISDPGTRLVQEALSQDIQVIPIPGPSALASALSVSGFGSEGHTFLGFLPRRKGRAGRLLQEAFGLGRTIVLYESPFRIESTLKLIEDQCPSAEIFLAREMTKMYEENIRGTVQTVRSRVTGRPQKGEFVVVIAPQEN